MAMVGQLSVQVEEGLAHMQMFGLFIYLLTLRLTSVAIFLALFFDLTVFSKNWLFYLKYHSYSGSLSSSNYKFYTCVSYVF